MVTVAPAEGTNLDPLPRWATPQADCWILGNIGEMMFLTYDTADGHWCLIPDLAWPMKCSWLSKPLKSVTLILGNSWPMKFSWLSKLLASMFRLTVELLPSNFTWDSDTTPVPPVCTKLSWVILGHLGSSVCWKNFGERGHNLGRLQKIGQPGATA
jgi:hypothetical protein